LRACKAQSCPYPVRMAQRKRSRMTREFLEQLERVRIEIETLAHNAGLTPTALAKKAGVQPSTVNKVLNRQRPVKHLPKESTLTKLRVAAGSTQHHNGSRRSNVATRLETPAPSRIPAWDLPIRAARNDRGALMFKQSGNFGYTRRPGSLSDISEAYAIRFVDDSMSPRYEPGWVGHVNPTLPPVPGRDVVIRLTDDSAVIGTLQQDTGSSYVLRQFNRPELLAILKANAKAIHRVVGSDQD
jgi:phage repressor protein C with HTH and peptisase S24 domain